MSERDTIQIHGEFSDPLGGGYVWCVQCVQAADCSSVGLYIADDNGDTVVSSEFVSELRELRDAINRAIAWVDGGEW